MSVSFARPEVSELSFHLYGRSLHPELFHIYDSAEISRDQYQARISIYDAGHMVSFQFGQQVITELIATKQQVLPRKKHFLDKRLHGCRDEAFDFQCGLRYQVSYQLEHLNQDVYLNFHEELLSDCHSATVACEFPCSSRMAPTPISLIRTEVMHNNLLVHAYHTFPESCAVVKTQSLFEL